MTMTFRICPDLFLIFFLIDNSVFATESHAPGQVIPALVGDNLTRSPVNGIAEPDQTIQCFLNQETPPELQWFTINQEGLEEEIQSNDGLTFVKAEDTAAKYRCKIDENTYADFIVRSKDEESEAMAAAEKESELSFRVKKFPKSISVVESEDLKVECKISLMNNSNIDTKNDLIFKWYYYNVTGDTDTYLGSLGNCSEEKQEGLNWQEVIVTRKQG